MGDRYDEVVGRVGAEEIYHAIFSFETYEKILANLHMRVLDFVRNDLIVEWPLFSWLKES